MKMRIATMVTGHFTCPPPKGVIYAPMLIAKTITDGLIKKGHEIVFFAPKGSRINATKLVSGGLLPLNPDEKNQHPIFSDPKTDIEKVKNLWDQYLISLVYQEALKKNIDLIHIHPADRALPFGLTMNDIPIVYTLHDPVYPWRAEVFRMFRSKNQYFVSISNAQRKPAPDLNWAATIYNGLTSSFFPFSKKPRNQLLFLGRLLPRKGPHIAIKAAKITKTKLLIAGAINDAEFWQKEIEPFLGKDIQYVGNISYEKTYKFYGQAKALLCPVTWEEPFGLTFIEAMACGTPVIAFNRGSVSEIVKDGKTGFVVEPFDEKGEINLKGFSEAIGKIDQIDRRECRKWVKENFTTEKMVDRYEEVFYKILADRKKI